MKNDIRGIKNALAILVLLCTVAVVSGQNGKNIRNEILAAMKKSSSYMVNTASCNGGYVWIYSEDLTERFGEIPARESQIWVQEGTHEMGHLFMDMYELTGDETYLDYAKKAARALIYGQHPLGGWHYFIDFDKKGLPDWYENTASQFMVGWEEYRHYYGNCTYDDNVTQGTTRYLLRLYMKTLEIEYLEPLKKALNFILVSQYPNGGWPQRYPLRYEFAHDGLPDYTSYYTLNDEAMNHTIDVLLEAYELLGDDKYLEAARRGADFFMIAQGPEGHAAWTDQFDMNLQPTEARMSEPASLQVRYTEGTIHQLEKMFLYTGDRRYLRPIPMALDWLKSVILEINENGDPVFARLYDPETNFPIISKEIPEINAEGYLKYKHTVDTTVRFVKFTGKLPIREQYEKIRDVEPGREREMYDKLYRVKTGQTPLLDEKQITALINTMNENGIWIETIRVHDKTRTMNADPEYVVAKGPHDYAAKNIQGFRTSTFMQNMFLFMEYLKN